MEQPQFPQEQPVVYQPPQKGYAALQYGLIFGGVVGIIDLLYSYLLDNGTITWFNGLFEAVSTWPSLFLSDAISGIVVSLPLYVLVFVASLLAGLLAARNAKRGNAGIIAGLLVGGLFLVIDLFIAIILLDLVVVFPQITATTPHADVSSVESSILTENIIYAVVADLILLGIAAGLGALGGVIGKGPSPIQAPSYIFVPSNPYQPQPPAYGNPYNQPLPPARPGQFPPDQPAGK